jgi:hypothetical protein
MLEYLSGETILERTEENSRVFKCRETLCPLHEYFVYFSSAETTPKTQMTEIPAGQATPAVVGKTEPRKRKLRSSEDGGRRTKRPQQLRTPEVDLPNDGHARTPLAGRSLLERPGQAITMQASVSRLLVSLLNFCLRKQALLNISQRFDTQCCCHLH